MATNNVAFTGAGALTGWTLKDLPQGRVQEIFRQHGAGKFIPQGRTLADCLRAALDSLFPGKTHVVKPHKDPAHNGFEVMLVNRGDEANQYPFVCSVKPYNSFLLTVWDENPQNFTADLSDALREEYEREQAIFTGAQVGTALVKAAMHTFSGVRTRDKGGLYWIPDHRLDDWTAFSNDLCSLHPDNRVDIFTLQANERTMLAVRQHIAGWVSDEVAAINEQLTGDSKRTLEARRSRVAAIRARIDAYGGVLAEMKEDLEKLATSANVAFVDNEVKQGGQLADLDLTAFDL